MDLCGGSYKPADDNVLVYCRDQCKPHSTIETRIERIADRNDAKQNSLPPPPVTPVKNAYSPDIEPRGIHYQGASPSPLFLNPMTDEDWSFRKLSSKLKMTLSEVDSRQLLDGVQLTLLLEKNCPIPVTMKFDAGKTIVCVSIDDADKTVGDEKKLDMDEQQSSLAPFHIPVKSLAGWKQEDSAFTLLLKSPCNGVDNLHFVCSNPCQRETIIEGLKTFMDARKSLRKRKWLPKLKSLPIDFEQQEQQHLHFHQEADLFSALDGRFSPISLTEDPTREEAASPEQPSPPFLSEASPRLIRVYEACSLPYHEDDFGRKPLSTPSEQGMELTLIDDAEEKANAAGNPIKIPALQESFSTDSTVQVTCTESTFGVCYPINEPGDLFRSSLSVPININPWCADDICTITSLTEAFRDLFGVGVMESRETGCSSAMECEVTSMTYAKCLSLSLLDFDDSQFRLKQSFSEEVVDAKTKKRSDTIRNRSESIHRQAEHWQRMKNEMTFEVVWRGFSNVMTTKSMDETDTAQISSQPRTSSFLETMFGQLYTPAFHTGNIETKTDDDDDDDDGILYYDSDPEYARERTFQGGSRQSERYELRRVPRLRLPLEIFHSKSLSDGDIKVIVNIMKSCTLYLLWHPNPTADVPNPKPCCVQAWIERGTYLLNKHFVQPKFMWKPVHEAQLASRRKINVKVEKFDLLEIARIDDNPVFIDRSIHPLAHQPACFVVRTKSSQYIFQAPNIQEKAHIVFGLKLAVARLASLLICRDMAAVEEFFEPSDAAVPGQAPNAAVAAVWLPES